MIYFDSINKAIHINTLTIFPAATICKVYKDILREIIYTLECIIIICEKRHCKQRGFWILIWI